MTINERLDALQTRINELSLRERGILFLVLIALLYFIWDGLLAAPQEKEQKQILSDIGKMRQEISALETQSLEIINRHNTDPNAEERKQLQQLETANDKLQQQITQAVDGLIEPQQMAKALESVLKEQKNLTFVRIENLGATSLITDDATAESTGDDIGIYKHTMRIELEGDYHSTLNYLRALEELPWRFHWESVNLKMLEYPRAHVIITVNTLSLSEGWIGV